MKKFKYIFGPVYSWRLGYSLGIDPLSTKQKVCSFDCLYCQIGPTKKLSCRRQIFVPTKKILDELKQLPHCRIDYLTFSGTGEPTLAKNLGVLIKSVKRLRKEKVAVITNASLLSQRQVRQDLSSADLVLVKLDASSPVLYEKIHRGVKEINFKKFLSGIRKFRREFKGKLALQIMFMKENKNFAKDLARLALEISPDEVQLNTPLRPCAIKPLTKNEMRSIKGCFKKMKVISVYDFESQEFVPFDKENTAKRHGQFIKG